MNEEWSAITDPTKMQHVLIIIPPRVFEAEYHRIKVLMPSDRGSVGGRLISEIKRRRQEDGSGRF